MVDCKEQVDEAVESVNPIRDRKIERVKVTLPDGVSSARIGAR
jgi:hypothetical protein